MHIKQVILDGFKSYREYIAVEPFHAKYNIIVGHNGAGKSNIFRAIEFVLCAPSNVMIRNVRYSVGNVTVPSAFVELILDNNDCKVPINTIDVSIRRTIDKKKDQYSVNGKNVTRTELGNLLETAGLSMKCPNYLIREGQINQIAMSNHSYRLQLLWEAANIRKYEERFNKMIDLLGRNDRLPEIRDNLAALANHRDFLNIQKQKLMRFTSFDQNKRAILYFKYQFKLKTYNDKLNQLKQEQEELERNQQNLLVKLEQSTNVTKTNSLNVDCSARELQTSACERDALRDSLKTMHKEKKKLELDVNTKSQQLERFNEIQQRKETDLQSLHKSISVNECDLKKVLPKFNKVKMEENNINPRLESMMQTRKMLYAKQGRNAHFASTAERDAVIQTQLELLNTAIIDIQETRNNMSNRLVQYVSNEEGIQEIINQETQKMEEAIVEIDRNDGNIPSLEYKINDAYSKMRELPIKAKNLQMKLFALEEEAFNIDIDRSSKIGSALLEGCNLVDNVVSGMNKEFIGLYKNLVVRNFSCDEKFDRLVENVADKMLLHHICDDENTVQCILNEMDQNKKTQVDITFMPINILEPPLEEYPGHLQNSLLINNISYDASIEPVMRMIFGNTVLCDDIDDEEDAENSNMNYVTWNGKYYSSNGEVKLCFDKSNSLISIERHRQMVSNQIRSINMEIIQLNNEMKKFEALIAQLQNAQLGLVKWKTIYDHASGNISLSKEQLLHNVNLRKCTEERLVKCDSDLKVMKDKQEVLQNELQQELLSQLSADEQEQLDILNHQIPLLQQKQKSVISSRSQMETEHKRLTNLLATFKSSRDKILSEIQEFARKTNDYELHCVSLQSTVNTIHEEICRAETKTLAMDNLIQDIKQNLTSHQTELDKWMQRKLSDQKNVEENLIRLDMLAEELSNLNELVRQTNDNIAELATQSRESFERYSNMPENMLDIELKRINQELKEHPLINMEAANQFNKVSTALESFSETAVELQISGDKINSLIENYEECKTKFVQQALRKMSSSFTEIFKKLVPSGRGELMIIKQDGFVTDFSGEISSEDTADSYTGIGIKVTFKESSQEMEDLIRLSGGQKSLVAVAFVLALHMFDPAPFYLLDEIDHALDAQYRVTLAQVINEMSENTQFITTTHWSEQLRLAHKIYGVKCVNSASSLKVVTREDARKFVKI